MKNILLFGGTTESRQIISFFEKEKIEAYVSVATVYGQKVLPDLKYCTVVEGRKNQEQIETFLREYQIKIVLDATHPYAVEVSENIKKATEQTGCCLMRIVREEAPRQSAGIYMKDLEELIEFLNQQTGIIFVTTGSKELPAFRKIKNYKERVYARVLPLESVMKTCMESGFERKQLIGGKGPFSVEENCRIIEQIGADFLVTKDTGKEGGFFEKVESARLAGAKLVVLERPKKEVGISAQEAIERITRDLKRLESGK